MSRVFTHAGRRELKVDLKTKAKIEKFRELGWTKDGISRQLKVPMEVVEHVVEQPRNR